MTGNVPASPPHKRAAGLYTIIAIKLGKALLLLLVALGLFSLAGTDLSDELEKFLRWINVDPERRFFAELGRKIDLITPGNLRWIGWGTLLYGVLLLIEGFGLWGRFWWAMWLAIGETAFFIPIEIVELVHRPSKTVVAILVVNVMIVGYLVRNRERLFRHGHGLTPGAKPDAVDYRAE